jgi:nucleoside-diphosphate-sugar epimerase
MKKTLVIGGAGYVGSQLVPALLASGRQVSVLDTFWYGHKHLESIGNPNLKLIEADMRDVYQVKKAIAEMTEVIHLACISNDPSFDLNPELGRSINLDSFRPIVQAIKGSGVQRFIYASSSSVYGIREEENVTEDLALAPLTDYSRFKAECEDIMMNEFSDNQVVTIVRPATVCGYSSRQRFDLVVNILTAHAIINKEIKVFGGSQFRPNLHIRDMVDSYIALLNAESKSIHREIFNIGSRNLTVKEIAQAVQKEVGEDIPIEFLDTNDLRSYRVDSSKILQHIGFQPTLTINDAIAELKDHFPAFNSSNPLTDPRYINIIRMKQLKLG